MGQSVDPRNGPKSLFVGLGTAGVRYLEGKLPETVQVEAVTQQIRT